MADNNNPFYNDYDGANASTDATDQQNQSSSSSATPNPPETTVTSYVGESGTNHYATITNEVPTNEPKPTLPSSSATPPITLTNDSTTIGIAPTAMLTPTQAAPNPSASQLDVSGPSVSSSDVASAAEQALKNYTPGGPPAGITVNGTWVPASIAASNPSAYTTSGSGLDSNIPTSSTYNINSAVSSPSASNDIAHSSGSTTNREMTGWVGEPGTDHMSPIIATSAETNPTGVRGITR